MVAYLMQTHQVKINLYRIIKHKECLSITQDKVEFGHDVVNVINMDNKQDASGPQWNICPELSGLTVPSYYENGKGAKSLHATQA